MTLEDSIKNDKINKQKSPIHRPSEATPDDLLEINEDNGVITVKEGALIDCDGDPKIFDLVYTVTLDDGLWTTDGEVTEPFFIIHKYFDKISHIHGI